MQIHISGEVIDDMVEEDGNAKYHISSDGKEYEVVARGGQAIKDYLFVRKHQQMEIEGILEAKRIFLKKAKIRLNKARPGKEKEQKS